MFERITQNITSVGVDNTSETKFENQYTLPHGMAYNSYVIKGNEKVAVIDAVEFDGFEQWRTHLVGVLGEVDPDFLVVQHMEPDHSATVREFCNMFPDAKIVCSAKAAAMLDQFFPGDGLSSRAMTVKEGDTLDLGGVTLEFIAAPMVHWPEVIVTYCREEKVLFSADAFGKFGAVSYRDDWANEARRYYTNIVGKYGAQVQSLLRKIAQLDIKTIAPLHGPVLKDKLEEYIDLYQKWSTYTPEVEGTLIAYASIYGNTRQLALLIADILAGMGEKVTTFDLCNQPLSEAVAQAFRHSRMILASVTYDGALFPAMHDFIYHLSIKGLRGRRVGLIENGSWGPVAARFMRDMLEKMRDMEVVEPVMTITSSFNHEKDGEKLRAFIEAYLPRPSVE